jgi:penicillin-binding protein-related factor A (putative recombinase)
MGLASISETQNNMTEAQIQSAIHRTLGSRSDVRLFRNHVGKVRDANGRWHTFGLAPGSADLIGWVRGRFLSIEVKSATGRVRPDQQTWMNVVNSHGGIAFVARSAGEAVELLEQYLK